MKWQQIANHKSLTIHLLQESAISALLEELGLEDENCVHTPYRSGCPVDKIPSEDHPSPLLNYKQHNNNSSQLLAPSTGSPVAHALTF